VTSVGTERALPVQSRRSRGRAVREEGVGQQSGPSCPQLPSSIPPHAQRYPWRCCWGRSGRCRSCRTGPDLLAEGRGGGRQRWSSLLVSWSSCHQPFPARHVLAVVAVTRLKRMTRSRGMLQGVLVPWLLPAIQLVSLALFARPLIGVGLLPAIHQLVPTCYHPSGSEVVPR